MNSRRVRSRGGALLLSAVIALLVASITGAFFSISLMNGRAAANADFALQAFYIAEAGAALCIQDLKLGGPGILSGRFSGGSFTIKKVDYGTDGKDNDADGQVDNSYESTFMELQVSGTTAGISRRLSILLSKNPGGVYWNALFAGNSSGDASYSLTLGGRGSQADRVDGSVYSDGGIRKTGDAVIDAYDRKNPGDLLIMYRRDYQDTSSQQPPAVYTQGTQSPPDLAAMHYETNHGVDVKGSLEASGSLGPSAGGGQAVQILDPENPAHIFRMNPSDRAQLTSGTVKNDYFLEDPTAPVRVDPNWDGSDACQIRLSTGSGNHKVYYVDGNLWLNNRLTYSFKIHHPEMTGVKVAFVVKGNVYLGDNFFYTNINKDAVAFIAMKDPAVPDSGNIYFGDPIFGTTRRFEGYMYAENNFYDNNLGTPSSMTTAVFGNMTAGNQVQIQRDKPDGSHVRLFVEFDEKAKLGNGPPGLPPNQSGLSGVWTIASWRQVP